MRLEPRNANVPLSLFCQLILFYENLYAQGKGSSMELGMANAAFEAWGPLFQEKGCKTGKDRLGVNQLKETLCTGHYWLPLLSGTLLIIEGKHHIKSKWIIRVFHTPLTLASTTSTCDIVFSPWLCIPSPSSVHMHERAHLDLGGEGERCNITQAWREHEENAVENTRESPGRM